MPTAECICKPAVPKAGMPVGGKAYGSKQKPPFEVEWVQSVNKTDFEQMWQTKYKSIDLCTLASDFYLLNALSANIPNGIPFDEYYTREAKYMFDRLVAEHDQPLQNYIDMAIGGELRYHIAMQPVLSNHRRSAWMTWKKIREKYGSQALITAEKFFLEFGGGSYGGPKWANACKVLHKRVTGKITPQHWVDLCMNLQHNGGCFFNKIDYEFSNRAGYGLNELQHTILPEHGREPVPNWNVLLKCASDDVVSLFHDQWKSANYNRIREHLPPIKFERPAPAYSYKGTTSFSGYSSPAYQAQLAKKKEETKAKLAFQKKYKLQQEWAGKKSNKVEIALVEWAADYIHNGGYDETCGCPGCVKVNKVWKVNKDKLNYILAKKYKVTDFKGPNLAPQPKPVPVSAFTKGDEELEKLLAEEEAIEKQKYWTASTQSTSVITADDLEAAFKKIEGLKNKPSKLWMPESIPPVPSEADSQKHSPDVQAAIDLVKSKPAKDLDDWDDPF